MNWQAVREYLLMRASEPTTWHGINVLLCSTMWNVAPELRDTVTWAGPVIAGALLVGQKERRP